MNLIERVKNILTTPKTEWGKISLEPQSMGAVIGSYVVPLVLIGGIATFIGYAFIGVNYGFFRTGTEWGIKMAIIQIVSVIVVYFVIGLILGSILGTRIGTGTL